MTETTSDSPTLVTTGNSISGQYTTVQSGAVVYTIHEENDQGSAGFTLDGGGTQTYSRTDTYNTNTGDRSSNETGSDGYALTESGSDAGGSYAQALSGTDDYTTVATSNDLNGGYNRTTSGSGDYTLVETDDGGDPVTTTGNHTFSTTGSGNYINGQVAQSATGVDRYMLLRAFNNTSNGGSGTAGTVDYSPVGAAFFLGNGVEGPTGGGALAAATDAVFGNLGSLPYQHCFAAGTLVLMADGSCKAIETIQPGEMVLAVSDRDPEGAVEARPVVEVYHNAPSRLLELRAASSRVCQAKRRRTTAQEASGDCESASVAVLEAPPSEAVIRTTPNHPFYVRGRGFTEAAELCAGDELRTASGGWIALGSVVGDGHVEPVYNFQVAGLHTYFVGDSDGAASVLVHNDSGGPPAISQPSWPPPGSYCDSSGIVVLPPIAGLSSPAQASPIPEPLPPTPPIDAPRWEGPPGSVPNTPEEQERKYVLATHVQADCAFGQGTDEQFRIAKAYTDSVNLQGSSWLYRAAYDTFSPTGFTPLGPRSHLSDCAAIAGPAAATAAVSGQPTCGPGPVTVNVGNAPGEIPPEEPGEPPQGEPAEQKPDLGQPGSMRNPDGTPKNAADQLQQLEEAQRQGRLIEETGRSKTNLQQRLNNYDPDDWDY